MLQLTQAQSKMASTGTEQQTLPKSSLLSLDCLYCEEKCWNNEEGEEEDDYDSGVSKFSSEIDFSSIEGDEGELVALSSKEGKSHFCEGDLDANEPFMEARRETLHWMMRVKAHHNFSANTLVLGVNYFDRFMIRHGFQKDRPWMTQLAAVACLSLASKIEEIHAPLLIDFQVESKYMFEAKTIQRMELLVLSTLEWKMNAVTPLSFFGYLMKVLKLNNSLCWETLCRCEDLILSAIADGRFLCYAPSVLAAAAIVQTLKELALWSPLQHQVHLMDVLKLNKDKAEECQKFIQELSSNDSSNKRKCVSSADSPRSVLDVVLSESSKDSSSVSSVVPSLQPLPKRSRTLLGFHCPA